MGGLTRGRVRSAREKRDPDKEFSAAATWQTGSRVIRFGGKTRLIMLSENV